MKRTLLLIVFAVLVLGGWASARQSQLTSRTILTREALMTSAGCSASDSSDAGGQ